MRTDAPDMMTRTGLSKEQKRGAAAANQERLASRSEKTCLSGLDVFFSGRAVVVCGNFPRAKQDVVDLWRLTHRHDNVLQRT
jgi:uncharacterized Rossmann fold enzyme